MIEVKLNMWKTLFREKDKLVTSNIINLMQPNVHRLKLDELLYK